MNIVILRGTLSSPPALTTLPSGDEVATYQLTVRPVEGPAESVPVALFAPPAAARRLREGHEVVVTGRVRRRFFRAGAATVSRTEVVATSIVAASHATRVGRLLDAAGRELARAHPATV